LIKSPRNPPFFGIFPSPPPGPGVVGPTPAATSAAAQAPAAGHRPHCGDAAPPRTVARGWRWCFRLGENPRDYSGIILCNNVLYIMGNIYIYTLLMCVCCLSIYIFIYVSIYFFIYLSIYLFIYLRSIYVILGYNEDVLFFYSYV